MDRAAEWRWRLARNTCELEREAVDDAHVARCVAHAHRMARRRAIEIPARRVTPFREFVVVVTARLDPFTWRRVRGRFRNGSHDVLDRFHGRKGTVDLQ